jgi:hypothetical protein
MREEINVTEEDGTPIKEFAVDMWITTEGVSEELVKDMFEMYSNGFTGMLEEMSFKKEPEEEKDLWEDDIRKEW